MRFESACFGPIEVDEECVIHFPEGLPGFEELRRFLPLNDARKGGLIFLQSLERASLCFLAMPVKALRPDYRITLTPEDRQLLCLAVEQEPVIGRDVVALAILSVAEGEPPTVNLRSPVVIHMKSRVAVQAIRPDERYQVREPLIETSEAVCS